MLPFHIHIIHYSLPITHSCALYSVRTRSKSKSILSDVHYFRLFRFEVPLQLLHARDRSLAPEQLVASSKL